MSLKLIAIDMDATLLRDDKSYDEEKFNEVYRALHALGIQVVIASGNSVGKLYEYLDHMDYETIYFAGDNGNYVEKAGETLDKTVISKEDAIFVYDLLKELGDYDIILSDGEHNYIENIREENLDDIQIYYRQVFPFDHIEELAEKGIVKMACYSRRSLKDAQDKVKHLMNKVPGVEAVTSGYNWTDVYHINGGKGHAVRVLQEKYGISPSETIAFGDSLNDASMMKEAGYRVSMANGDPALKAFTNYEIGTNEDQAVIQVLEEFVKEGNLDFMEKYKK